MSNIPLKTITFPGLDDTYTIPQVDNTLLTAGAAADAKKTGDEITDLKEALTDVSATLTHKADIDGTVASAEQLLSDVGTEDKQPYLFRATPYDSTRVDEELVGVSVGWNQLCQNGDFASSTGWSIVGTNSPTLTVANNVANCKASTASSAYIELKKSSDFAISPNHVYLLLVDVEMVTGSGISFVPAGYASPGFLTVSFTGRKVCSYVWKPEVSIANLATRINATSGQSEIIEANVRNYMLIDLTAWFGSTIADYAYTLEQATAGSGVAWIKALLPGGYIPYSAPTLKSVSGLSGHKFTGFNAWDEVWEAGKYNTTTGAAEANNSYFRSKNMIPILPNTEYCATTNADFIGLFYYDKSGAFLSYESKALSSGTGTFTTPANAYGLKFQRWSTDNKTTCINLSDPARNGQYEPYKATTYALDSDLTLRGILKMDSDHRVYADGDRHLPDGTVNRRYGVVDLGTLDWTAQTLSGGRTAFCTSYGTWSDAPKVSNSATANAVCTVVSRQTYQTATSWGSDVFLFSPASGTLPEGTLAFIFDDGKYADATAFKTAMDGVKFVYEKATATTETADPFASPQICAPGGTEEYVYAEGGSGVLVGHNSKYQKNLKGELERVSVAVPDAPSANGTYSLKATVSSGTVTYAWVSD